MYSTMAAVFRRWQDDLSISYGEIARRAGLSVPSVSAIMRGESTPKADSVSVICAAFGRSESDLLRAMADLSTVEP